ncbi:MAG: outer membrane lipoprotein-sorting protein [Spirochaetes bacterium]|nr:outer membrane lipoprotein-sorting protein [Spirochaetota bacterium]
MKSKKLLKAITVVFFSVISGVLSSLFAITGTEIMIKADNRPDGNDKKMEMKMILENRRGKQRIRSMMILTKDYGKDTKSVYFFKEPADVKGTGFLVWGYDDPGKDDDRWLYLPALKKSKRISGSSKNDYFMGSDLTYDDMGNRSVDEDIHSLVKEENLDGTDCWVVESVPKDKDYMYSKIISWIRKDSDLGVKREFYDKHGKLLKTMILSDIRPHQGYWTYFKMEVNNSREKHKTILIIENMNYDNNLKDSLFRVSTLERGQIR